MRFHDEKCQACAGSAPTCNAACFLPEGKIGRRTVVPNVHALAMLSELQRIGSCSCPVKKQKPPPDLKRPSNAIALRANLVEVRLRDLRHTARLCETSDCGTFDPRASSNVSFAPAFIPFIKRELYVAMWLPYNIHELPSAQQCLGARRDIRAS